MIRITRHTDYAIRVILALAKRPPGARLSTARIREEMLIPAALSARIVAELARGNFIHTFPGRDGGLQLARPAEEINLRQVVEYFEGPIDVSECLIAEGPGCVFEASCPVRRRWARLRRLIREELESQTFDQLARETLQSDIGLAQQR